MGALRYGFSKFRKTEVLIVFVKEIEKYGDSGSPFFNKTAIEVYLMMLSLIVRSCPLLCK